MSKTETPGETGAPPDARRSQRVWLDISLARLCRNFRNIAAAVAPSGVMAVLKANAYGLGERPIAEALAQAGVARFGVAEPREAMLLADLGVPIQVLGGVLPDEIPELVANDITLPIIDFAAARAISRAATRQKRTARVHFKIDTGMGRLGIHHTAAVETIRRAATLPGLRAEGVYSHFPVAYQAGSEYTMRQIRLFRELLSQLRRAGLNFKLRHIANSDAINNFPEACRKPFNLVRTGINLHGSFDSEGMRRLELLPILTLKTRLTAVRTLPAGTALGYGLTYRLPRRTRVGVISAGYADGLPLALSNRGYVLINNLPCPVLGRISMDYTTISLAEAPAAAVGDVVTCLGGDGVNAITVDDWAKLKGTHPYEIICSFGTRVQRRYI